MKANYTYREIFGLTKFLNVLLGLGAAMAVVSLFSSFMQSELLSRSFSEAEGQANDFRQQLIGRIGFALYCFTVVVFGSWIVRAHKNVRALGADGLRETPGWAVGSFFFPILNLWVPYQAMRDLWQASHNPRSWKDAGVDAILPEWWTLWIVSNFLGHLSFRATTNAQGLEGLQSATYWQIAALIVNILLYWAAMSLVTQIADAQRTTAESGGSGLSDGPRTIRIFCPGCSRRLRGATSDMIGDLGVCPKCRTEFVITGPTLGPKFEADGSDGPPDARNPAAGTKSMQSSADEPHSDLSESLSEIAPNESPALSGCDSEPTLPVIADQAVETDTSEDSLSGVSAKNNKPIYDSNVAISRDGGLARLRPDIIDSMGGKNLKLGIALTVAAAVGVVVGWLLSDARREWKSSGDGKTIFNVRTGELIVTASGRSVSELEAERRENARETSQRNARYLDQQKRASREAFENLQQRRADEELAAKQVRLSNLRHYCRIRQFFREAPIPPDDQSSVEPNVYRIETPKSLTRPYRIDSFPTKTERDLLVKSIDTMRHESPSKYTSEWGQFMSSADWQAVIENLQRLEFDRDGQLSQVGLTPPTYGGEDDLHFRNETIYDDYEYMLE